MTTSRESDSGKSNGSPFEMPSAGDREVLDEVSFKRMIAIERKRTERSNEPFLLMLIEAGSPPSPEIDAATLGNMATALMAASRGTDVIGWYRDRTTIGLIFSGLAGEDKNTILTTILGRVKATLRDELLFDQINQVSISFHFFPDEWNHTKGAQPINLVLYPDLLSAGPHKKSQLAMKRVMDVVGSALALVVTSPLFWLISLAIKLTSKGPVFFSQTRVGQYGKPFVLLKFRTMYTDIDRSVHKQYVTDLIAAKTETDDPNPKGPRVYKLTNDKRITRVGNFLRRTSLDELPQFINVLQGEMSLVGPRPAVRYEVAAYETWHRRRVLDFKPGITGLWQVSGRSHVKFDEMVRLDLRYARMWTPWLDIKILLRTPLAVIKGTGAY